VNVYFIARRHNGGKGMSKIKRAFSMFLSVAMIATSIYVPNPVAVYAEEEESIMTGGSEEQVEMPAGEDTSLSGEDYELPGVEEDTEDDSSEFETQIESEEVDVSTVEEDVNIITDLENVEEEEEEVQEEALRSFDDEEETLGAFPALQNQGIIEDFDEFVMTDYVSTSNPQVALKDITDYKGKIRYVQDTEVAIATDPVIQFSNKGTKIASKSYKGYARLTAGIGLEAFTFITGGDDSTADKSAVVTVVAKALDSNGDTLLLYDENSNMVDAVRVSSSGAVYELIAPTYGKYYLGTADANSNIYSIKVELNSPKLYNLTVEGVTAVFYDADEDEMTSTDNGVGVKRGDKVYIEKQSTYGKNTTSVATNVGGVTVTELDVDYYSVTMPAQDMRVTFTLEPGQYELTYPASVKEVLAGGTSIVSGTTPVTYNSVLSVRVTKLPEKTAHLYMSYEDADGNYVNKREVALTEDASTEDPSYTASINMPGSKTALSVTYDDVPYDPYEISGTGFTVTGGSDATHAFKDTVVTVVPDVVTDDSVVSGVTYSYTDSDSHVITYYAQQVGSSQNYQFKMPAYNVTVTLIRSYPIYYSATGVTRYTSNVTATPNVFRYNSTDYVKPGANVTITVKDEESDLTLGLTVGGEAYSTGTVITQPTSTKPTGTITIDSMPVKAVTVTIDGTSYVPVTFKNTSCISSFRVKNSSGTVIGVTDNVISKTFKAGEKLYIDEIKLDNSGYMLYTVNYGTTSSALNTEAVERLGRYTVNIPENATSLYISITAVEKYRLKLNNHTVMYQDQNLKYPDDPILSNEPAYGDCRSITKSYSDARYADMASMVFVYTFKNKSYEIEKVWNDKDNNISTTFTDGQSYFMGDIPKGSVLTNMKIKLVDGSKVSPAMKVELWWYDHINGYALRDEFFSQGYDPDTKYYNFDMRSYDVTYHSPSGYEYDDTHTDMLVVGPVFTQAGGNTQYVNFTFKDISKGDIKSVKYTAYPDDEAPYTTVITSGNVPVVKGEESSDYIAQVSIPQNGFGYLEYTPVLDPSLNKKKYISSGGDSIIATTPATYDVAGNLVTEPVFKTSEGGSYSLNTGSLVRIDRDEFGEGAEPLKWDNNGNRNIKMAEESSVDSPIMVPDQSAVVFIKTASELNAIPVVYNGESYNRINPDVNNGAVAFTPSLLGTTKVYSKPYTLTSGISEGGPKYSLQFKNTQNKLELTPGGTAKVCAHSTLTSNSVKSDDSGIKVSEVSLQVGADKQVLALGTAGISSCSFAEFSMPENDATLNTQYVPAYTFTYNTPETHPTDAIATANLGNALSVQYFDATNTAITSPAQVHVTGEYLNISAKSGYEILSVSATGSTVEKTGDTYKLTFGSSDIVASIIVVPVYNPVLTDTDSYDFKTVGDIRITRADTATYTDNSLADTSENLSELKLRKGDTITARINATLVNSAPPVLVTGLKVGSNTATIAENGASVYSNNVYSAAQWNCVVSTIPDTAGADISLTPSVTKIHNLAIPAGTTGNISLISGSSTVVIASGFTGTIPVPEGAAISISGSTIQPVLDGKLMAIGEGSTYTGVMGESDSVVKVAPAVPVIYNASGSPVTLTMANKSDLTSLSAGGSFFTPAGEDLYTYSLGTTGHNYAQGTKLYFKLAGVPSNAENVKVYKTVGSDKTELSKVGSTGFYLLDTTELSSQATISVEYQLVYDAIFTLSSPDNSIASNALKDSITVTVGSATKTLTAGTGVYDGKYVLLGLHTGDTVTIAPVADSHKEIVATGTGVAETSSGSGTYSFTVGSADITDISVELYQLYSAIWLGDAASLSYKIGETGVWSTFEKNTQTYFRKNTKLTLKPVAASGKLVKSLSFSHGAAGQLPCTAKATYTNGSWTDSVWSYTVLQDNLNTIIISSESLVDVSFETGSSATAALDAGTYYDAVTSLTASGTHKLPVGGKLALTKGTGTGADEIPDTVVPAIKKASGGFVAISDGKYTIPNENCTILSKGKLNTVTKNSELASVKVSSYKPAGASVYVGGSFELNGTYFVDGTEVLFSVEGKGVVDSVTGTGVDVTQTETGLYKYTVGSSAPIINVAFTPTYDAAFTLTSTDGTISTADLNGALLIRKQRGTETPENVDLSSDGKITGLKAGEKLLIAAKDHNAIETFSVKVGDTDQSFTLESGTYTYTVGSADFSVAIDLYKKFAVSWTGTEGGISSVTVGSQSIASGATAYLKKGTYNITPVSSTGYLVTNVNVNNNPIGELQTHAVYGASGWTAAVWRYEVNSDAELYLTATELKNVTLQTGSGATAHLDDTSVYDRVSMAAGTAYPLPVGGKISLTKSTTAADEKEDTVIPVLKSGTTYTQGTLNAGTYKFNVAEGTILTKGVKAIVTEITGKATVNVKSYTPAGSSTAIEIGSTPLRLVDAYFIEGTVVNFTVTGKGIVGEVTNGGTAMTPSQTGEYTFTIGAAASAIVVNFTPTYVVTFVDASGYAASDITGLLVFKKGDTAISGLTFAADESDGSKVKATVTVTSADSLTIESSNADKYRITSVKDGESDIVPENGKYTVPVVNSDKTVTINYKKYYEIKSVDNADFANLNSHSYKVGDQEVSFVPINSTVTVAPVPKAGYLVTGIYIDYESTTSTTTDLYKERIIDNSYDGTTWTYAQWQFKVPTNIVGDITVGYVVSQIRNLTLEDGSKISVTIADGAGGLGYSGTAADSLVKPVPEGAKVALTYGENTGSGDGGTKENTVHPVLDSGTMTLIPNMQVTLDSGTSTTVASAYFFMPHANTAVYSKPVKVYSGAGLSGGKAEIKLSSDVGKIRKSGEEIDDDAGLPFAKGTPVSFTITPKAVKDITNVKYAGGDALTATNGVYSITVGSEEAAVTADSTPIYTYTFEQAVGDDNEALADSVTISVVHKGAGGAELEPKTITAVDNVFKEPNMVTGEKVTIAPNTGYRLVSVTYGDSNTSVDIDGTTKAATFTVGSDAASGAANLTFKISAVKEYSLTIPQKAKIQTPFYMGTSGTASGELDGKTIVPGNVITITPTPVTGNNVIITGVTVKGTPLAGGDDENIVGFGVERVAGDAGIAVYDATSRWQYAGWKLTVPGKDVLAAYKVIKIEYSTVPVVTLQRESSTNGATVGFEYKIGDITIAKTSAASASVIQIPLLSLGGAYTINVTPDAFDDVQPMIIVGTGTDISRRCYGTAGTDIYTFNAADVFGASPNAAAAYTLYTKGHDLKLDPDCKATVKWRYADIDSTSLTTLNSTGFKAVANRPVELVIGGRGTVGNVLVKTGTAEYESIGSPAKLSLSSRYVDTDFAEYDQYNKVITKGAAAETVNVGFTTWHNVNFTFDNTIGGSGSASILRDNAGTAAITVKVGESDTTSTLLADGGDTIATLEDVELGKSVTVSAKAGYRIVGVKKTGSGETVEPVNGVYTLTVADNSTAATATANDYNIEVAPVHKVKITDLLSKNTDSTFTGFTVTYDDAGGYYTSAGSIIPTTGETVLYKGTVVTITPAEANDSNRVKDVKATVGSAVSSVAYDENAKKYTFTIGDADATLNVENTAKYQVIVTEGTESASDYVDINYEDAPVSDTQVDHSRVVNVPVTIGTAFYVTSGAVITVSPEASVDSEHVIISSVTVNGKEADRVLDAGVWTGSWKVSGINKVSSIVVSVEDFYTATITADDNVSITREENEQVTNATKLVEGDVLTVQPKAGYRITSLKFGDDDVTTTEGSKTTITNTAKDVSAEMTDDSGIWTVKVGSSDFNLTVTDVPLYPVAKNTSLADAAAAFSASAAVELTISKPKYSSDKVTVGGVSVDGYAVGDTARIDVKPKNSADLSELSRTDSKLTYGSGTSLATLQNDEAGYYFTFVVPEGIDSATTFTAAPVYTKYTVALSGSVAAAITDINGAPAGVDPLSVDVKAGDTIILDVKYGTGYEFDKFTIRKGEADIEIETLPSYEAVQGVAVKKSATQPEGKVRYEISVPKGGITSVAIAAKTGKYKLSLHEDSINSKIALTKIGGVATTETTSTLPVDIDYDKTVEFTVTPDDDFHFDDTVVDPVQVVKADGTPVTLTADAGNAAATTKKFSFTMIDEPLFIKALMAGETYSTDVKVYLQDGTTTTDVTENARSYVNVTFKNDDSVGYKNEAIEFTIAQAAGYSVVEREVKTKVGDVAVGVRGPEFIGDMAFDMPSGGADIVVTVKAKEYAITKDAKNADITIDGDLIKQSVGKQVSFAVAENAGFGVPAVSISYSNGTDTVTYTTKSTSTILTVDGGVYSFLMPAEADGSVTIHATAKAIPYYVNMTLNGQAATGAVESDAVQSITITKAKVDPETLVASTDEGAIEGAVGTDVTVVITYKPGYTADSLTFKQHVDNADITPAPVAEVSDSTYTYTFAMPVGGADVALTTKAESYTVDSTTQVQNATVAVTDGVTEGKAVFGSTIKFTVTPDTDYTLDSANALVQIVDAEGTLIDNIDFTIENAPEADAAGSVVGNPGTYSFKMPAQAAFIKVVPVDKVYTAVTASDYSQVAVITFEPETAKVGDTVTLTITEKAGYTVHTKKLVDKDSHEINLTQVGEASGIAGKFTFKMVSGGVTLSITDEANEYNIFTDESENVIITLDVEGLKTVTSQLRGQNVAFSVAAKSADYVLDTTSIKVYMYDTVDTQNPEAVEFTGPEADKYSFNMPAGDVIITAKARAKTYSVTVDDTALKADHVTVTVTPASGTIEKDITITAVCDPGYWLNSLKIGQTEITGVDEAYDKTTNKYSFSKTIKMPSGGGAVSVETDTLNYDVFVDAEHATIAGIDASGEAAYGSTVSFTVTPDMDYTLVGGSIKAVYADNSEHDVTVVTAPAADDEGAVVGKPGTYSIVVPAQAVTIKAQSVAKTYGVTVADGVDNVATVTLDPEDGIAAVGETVKITLAEKPGYTVTSRTLTDKAEKTVAINGSGMTGQLSFTMVSGGVTLDVTAEPKQHDITKSAVNAAIKVTGAAEDTAPEITKQDAKQAVYFAVTPDVGFVVADTDVKVTYKSMAIADEMVLTVSDGLEYNEGFYSFTMPDEVSGSVKVSATGKAYENKVDLIQNKIDGINPAVITADRTKVDPVELTPSTDDDAVIGAVGTDVGLEIRYVAGYELESIKVTEKKNPEKEVELESIAAGKYSFKIPAGGAVVSVVSKPVDYKIDFSGIKNATVSDVTGVTDGKAPYKGTVSFKLTPDVDYTLLGKEVSWKYGNGAYTLEPTEAIGTDTEYQGAAATYSFTVPAFDSQISVAPVAKTYTAVLAEGCAQYADVTFTKTSAAVGETVGMTITPKSGYTVTGRTLVDKNGKSVAINGGLTGEQSFAMVSGGVTLYINHSANEYNIYTDETEHVEITLDEENLVTLVSQLMDQKVYFTVAADSADYELVDGSIRVYSIADDGVTETDVAVEGPVSDKYSFTMPADDVIVKARATARAYNVTVDDAALKAKHATVTVTPASGTIEDDVTITVVCDPGYMLGSLKIGQTEVTDLVETYIEATNKYSYCATVNVPSGGGAISVETNTLTYDVWVDAEHATIAGLDPSGEAEYGSTVNFNVTPDTDYTLVGGSIKAVYADGSEHDVTTVTAPGADDEGALAGKAGNYKIEMPAQAVAIKVEPAAKTYGVIIEDTVDDVAVVTLDPADGKVAVGEEVRMNIKSKTGLTVTARSVKSILTDKSVAVTGDSVDGDLSFAMVSGGVKVNVTAAPVDYDIITDETDAVVTIFKDSVAFGSIARFDAAGVEGYKLMPGSVKILDEAGNDISDEVALDGDLGKVYGTGSFSFRMPSQNVKVSATGVKKQNFSVKYEYDEDVVTLTDPIESVMENDEVTISSNVIKGYEITEVTAADSDGNEVEVTLKAGTYKAVMPENDLIVTIKTDRKSNGETTTREDYERTVSENYAAIAVADENKAFEGTVPVMGAADDDAIIIQHYSKGKVKSVSISENSTGRSNVTINTRVKVRNLTGYTVVSAYSGTEWKGVSNVKLPKIDKKGCMRLKKIKGVPVYTIVLNGPKGQVNIKVVDVKFYPGIKKAALDANAFPEEYLEYHTVSGNTVSANTVSSNKELTPNMIEAMVLDITDSAWRSSGFVTGVVKVGKTKMTAIGKRQLVKAGSKASVYVTVNTDGTILLEPVAGSNGTVKITYTPNGRSYKTSVKLSNRGVPSSSTYDRDLFLHGFGENKNSIFIKKIQ